MKTKLIVLLLVLSAVLFSGCAGNEQPSSEENATPEETVTPEEIATPEETETPAETETSEEVETPAVTETEEENVTAEENGTEGPAVTSPEIKTTPYTIRLDNYRASVSSLDIKEGESVAWINYQDSPRRTFTLVSEQGLFENQSLVYKRSFAYTFNETGAYNFIVVGQPKMSVNVTVSEP